MARSDGLPAAEYAAMKRQARENDAAQQVHYESQMRAEGVDPATGQSTTSSTSSRGSRPFGSTSSRGSRDASRASAAAKPSFVPVSVHDAVTSSSGGTVAGAMLGALLFFTGRSYIKGGFSGVKAFYAAKFLNRTSANPNPVPASAQTTPASSTPSPGTSSSSPGTSSSSDGQKPAGSRTGGTRLKAVL